MMILHVENPHWSGLLMGYRIQNPTDILTAFCYGGCHVLVTLDESTYVTRGLSSWKCIFYSARIPPHTYRRSTIERDNID